MKNDWTPFKPIELRPLEAVAVGLSFIVLIGLILRALYNPSNSSSDSLSIIAVAISAAGFLLNLINQVSKPILTIEPEGSPIPSAKPDQTPSSWFLRLLVFNNGLVNANNCVGKLIEIRDDKGEKISKFDPFLFYWTMQNNEVNPITIFGRGDYAILDILEEKVSSSMATIRIHTNNQPLTNQGESSTSPSNTPDLVHGSYYLKIGVYAENSSSSPKWFKLDIREPNNGKSNTSLKEISQSKIPKL